MLGFGFGYFSAIPVNKGTLMDPNGPLNENLDRLYDGPLTLFVYTEYEIWSSCDLNIVNLAYYNEVKPN